MTAKQIMRLVMKENQRLFEAKKSMAKRNRPDLAPLSAAKGAPITDAQRAKANQGRGVVIPTKHHCRSFERGAMFVLEILEQEKRRKKIVG